MNFSILRKTPIAVSIAFGLLVLALGGCSDGGSSQQLGSAALAVSVHGGLTNPPGVINAATAGKVVVLVTLPPESMDTDVVTVVLSDGQGTEASAQAVGTGQTGGGTARFEIDASGLADGSVDVLVQSQTDSGTGESTFAAAFLKDTVAPELPTSLEPLNAQGSPSQYVNAATAPAATVAATFQNAGGGSDKAQLFVRAGSQQVRSEFQTYATTSLSFSNLDLTTLPEGTVDVELVLTDANLNVATMTVQATKDTVAPAGALAAQVWGTLQNPVDAINIATAASVTTVLGLSADVEARNVWVSMTDSLTTVASQPENVPLGGGIQWVSGLDASTLADGAITIVATVSDLAGNEVAFTGTTATKDTVAPAAPTAADVMAGPSNPSSVINLASASAVGIALTWPAGSVATDSATVSAANGASSISSSAFNPPAGGGASNVTSLDCTPVTDGTVSLAITVMDAAGNTTTAAGTAALKDTIPPVAPSIARVAGGGANNQDVVNIASVGGVMGSAVFGPAAEVGETFVMSFSDGSNSVSTSGGAVPGGGGTAGQGPVDLSGLVDGFVTVTVTVSDVAQNQTMMTGSTALKDTVAPTGPVACSVSSGAGNGSDVINLSNVGAVSVSVIWPAGAPGSEAAQVTLAGGGTVSAAVSQVAGGGSTTVAGIDASALADGSVSLSVTTTDGAGNVVSFSGTAASKDTVGPIAAMAPQIPSGPSNPANWVNGITVSGTTVQVSFGAGASGSDVVSLACTDGTSTVNSGSQTVPAGGGVVTFTGINLTALQDGSLSLTAMVADAAGNTSTTTGTGASKDTVAPVNPTAAQVPGGTFNPVDTINTATVLASQVSVSWPGDAGNESMYVILSDGVSSQAALPQTLGAGAATVSFINLNCTPLADGPISVMVSVTDAAGNLTSYAGTGATKDTVPPSAPSAAQVVPTAGNPLDMINAASVAAVTCSVTFPSGSNPFDAATVTLSDGTAGVSTAAQSVLPGAAMTFAGIDCTTLADGPVSVSVNVIDVAGNQTTFAGTPAQKDTAAPSAATLAVIPAGPNNPANYVNVATQGSVSVDVTVPAQGAGLQLAISVSGTDGSTAVGPAPVAAPAAGGVVSFTGIGCAGMSDGTLTITATITDAASNQATYSVGYPKDTVSPATPTAAHVAAGPSNSAGVVNAASATNAGVVVTWPGDTASDAMYVVLSDGVASVTSATQTAGTGASTVNFSGMNAATLADGSMTVSVHVTDPAGNTSIYAGTPATKDTVAPAAATSAQVITTTGNPPSVINASSAAAVSCQVGFPAGSDPTDVATVTLSDGTGSASSASQDAVSAGSVTFPGIGAGSLNDGSIAVSVTVTDLAGNQAVSAGTPATKDTVAPLAPTGISVAASPRNPANWVNLLGQAGINVTVNMPNQGPGMQVALSVTDMTTTVAPAPAEAPAAGGVMTFSGLNLSAMADGPLSLAVTVTDRFGNVTQSSGTATKDVVPPTAPVVDPVTTPTASSQQSVTGQADAAAAITVTGGSSPASGSASATGRFSVATSLTSNSTNNLVVQATEASGNSSSSTLAFTGAALAIVHNAAAPPVSFTDVSAASGLADTGAVGGGAFQDIDNDGDLDLFVGGANKLWQNDGSGVFTDITATAGTFIGGKSAVFADYDNDGDLDLLSVDGTATMLMRNEWIPLGLSQFVDVTAASGTSMSGTLSGAYWADFDQDGLDDLVVLDSASQPQARRNKGTGPFVAPSPFAAAASTMYFGVVADIVADGYPDFIFGQTTPSAFYRGAAGLAFTDIAGPSSNVVIDHASAGGGIIAVDYDNDGDLDVIAASGGKMTASASCGGCPLPNNLLFANVGTSAFTDQIGAQTLAQLAGIEASDGWIDVCAGDVNADGRVDLFVGTSGAHRLFLNAGDTNFDGVFEFVEVAGACGVAGVGTTKMVQMADVDGDGDLDLFAGNDLTANEVFRNDINNRRNLTVLVNGLAAGSGSSSRAAVGSHVDLLDATGTTLLASREISGGRGFGTQDALRAHFGVTPSEIYTVRVTFSSGAVRYANNVVPRDAVNQTITVNE